MKGQVAQARSLTEQYTDFAELQQPGRAIGEVLVAHVAIAQGDFDTGVALLQRAEVLEPTGYSWGSLALILLADALGQRGEATGAAKALSHAEARHGMKSALFAPELALARTWTRMAERDREGSRRLRCRPRTTRCGWVTGRHRPDHPAGHAIHRPGSALRGAAGQVGPQHLGRGGDL
jgi:hypothetical protein